MSESRHPRPFELPADRSLMIAHIVAKMTLVQNGRLLATGVHDKAVVDPQVVTSRRSSKL